jgi:uncharacterized protein YbcV (DUF1398 family)
MEPNMDAKLVETARGCLAASFAGTKDFPASVRALLEAGFEGYTVDFRRGKATYFLPSGDSLELTMPALPGDVEPQFNAPNVEQAVREAQSKRPGYTYRDFCAKVKAAGCAGYMVSFPGRRVVYFGRTAETHVEHFPQ